MSRRFSDARELLNHLLDRHEFGTASPLAYPDYTSFASVVAADGFIKEIARAEKTGAVRAVRGKGRHREQVVHVRLEDPEALYRYLDRTPAAAIAQGAHSRLVEGLSLHPGLVDAAAKIAAAWARAKEWNGFGAADAEKLRTAFALAQAVLDRRHEGIDYRTFSRRTSGDSKALERVEGPVVRLLSGIIELPPGAKPRDALRTLGLEKFAPPLLLAGRLDLAGADLSRAAPLYFGISPNDADRISFRTVPAYLPTVENFASFNRHLIEADPDRIGVTIFVGGYPSLATQQALGVLAGKLPETVPLFHWSDIDPGGTWIYRTIEAAMGRRLRPHLMSVEIAEQFGRPTVGKSDLRACPAESGIAPLVAYLALEDAKTLEQEELDPRLPVGPKADRTEERSDLRQTG
jgi:Wadjet protein JetD, C-terminal